MCMMFMSLHSATQLASELVTSYDRERKKKGKKNKAKIFFFSLSLWDLLLES